MQRVVFVLFAVPFLSIALGDTGATTPIRFLVSGFDVIGPNPLSAQATSRLLAPFSGEHSGLDRLRAAADALEQAIRKEGFSFYRVVLPAQTISGDSVTLQIISLAIESVTISGNRHYSDKNIRASLPELREGGSPNTKKLSRTLRIANKNPGKRTSVKFRVEEDTRSAVEAHINVRDERAHQVYAWLNNSGNEETGNTRIGVGYQHSNVFQKDQVGTLNFTTSVEETENVVQLAASYQIPFYQLDSQLNVYAIRSDVDTGTVATFFNVSGRGDFYGGWFTYLLPRMGTYRHELIIGFDDKLFDNDIDFQGQPIGVDVRSRPLSVRYTGTWGGGKTTLAWSAGYYVNLPGGSHNNDSDYAATRAGASPDWSLFRYSGQIDKVIGRWNLIGRLSGQHTDEALIPGEQFGVGGLESVRGLEERALTGDRAIVISAEVWTPFLGRGPRLVGFIDAGGISQSNTLPGEIEDTTVVTAGIGARWNWKRHLNARVDVGYVLDGAAPADLTGVNKNDSKTHFNLLYRF